MRYLKREKNLAIAKYKHQVQSLSKMSIRQQIAMQSKTIRQLSLMQNKKITGKWFEKKKIPTTKTTK
jgi:hypothetical protein